MASVVFSRKRRAAAHKANEAPKATKEAKTNAGSSVGRRNELVVTDSDVLLGRGKGSYESPGNLKFLKLVYKFLPEYTLASRKQDKTRLSEDIVSCVKRDGGRFLKYKGKTIIFVSDDEARLKVSQALRHRRREYEKDKNCKYCDEVFSKPVTDGPVHSDPLVSFRSNRTDDTDYNVSSSSNRTDESLQSHALYGDVDLTEDPFDIDSQGWISDISSKLSSLDIRGIFESKVSVTKHEFREKKR